MYYKVLLAIIIIEKVSKEKKHHRQAVVGCYQTGNVSGPVGKLGRGLVAASNIQTTSTFTFSFKPTLSLSHVSSINTFSQLLTSKPPALSLSHSKQHFHFLTFHHNTFSARVSRDHVLVDSKPFGQLSQAICLYLFSSPFPIWDSKKQLHIFTSKKCGTVLSNTIS